MSGRQRPASSIILAARNSPPEAELPSHFHCCRRLRRPHDDDVAARSRAALLLGNPRPRLPACRSTALHNRFADLLPAAPAAISGAIGRLIDLGSDACTEPLKLRVIQILQRLREVIAASLRRKRMPLLTMIETAGSRDLKHRFCGPAFSTPLCRVHPRARQQSKCRASAFFLQ
jgi:hypothetical protein